MLFIILRFIYFECLRNYVEDCHKGLLYIEFISTERNIQSKLFKLLELVRFFKFRNTYKLHQSCFHIENKNTNILRNSLY